MDVLTKEHVLGLIDDVIYDIDPQVIVCKLIVGEATIVGTSYCFSKTTYDPERGKLSAYNNAIDQLFSLEAYHQKRLRGLTYADRVSILAAGIALTPPHEVGGRLEVSRAVDENGVERITSITRVGKCEHTGNVEYSSISEPGISVTKFGNGGASQEKAEELIQAQNRLKPAKVFMTSDVEVNANDGVSLLLKVNKA